MSTYVVQVHSWDGESAAGLDRDSVAGGFATIASAKAYADTLAPADAGEWGFRPGDEDFPHGVHWRETPDLSWEVTIKSQRCIERELADERAMEREWREYERDDPGL